MNKRITHALCILLALVLMSSSAVGYTYAEYATMDSASDDTRASNFGVTASVTGGGFAKKYVTSTTYDGIDVSVVSSSNIIAPGTTGTFTGIKVSGTAETAVNIAITANLDVSNFKDASGNYYCPLRITVNGTTYYGLDYATYGEFETAVENAIKAGAGQKAAGTNLGGISGLNGNYTWLWDWNGSNGTKVTRTNAKDTALQGTAQVTLAVTCSVTQVD